jgi:AIR synthase-related protein
MTRERLAVLAERLAASAAFRAKRDIAAVAARIEAAPCAVADWQERPACILLGDDAAAIPDGPGYLLLAAEGMLPDFLDRDPYFAGWSAIMVNVSDVAAMGGYPLAVVDVYLHGPASAFDAVVGGMRDASRAYGVPIVGGHTTRRESGAQLLAVAILGRAEHLLTSFGARPGDALLFAVDLRGRYRAGLPFWNATEGRAGESLRADLALLGALAAGGAVHACKDVSNAGLAGTLLMLVEASGVGAVLDIDRVPRPADIEALDWLLTFPSYGFLLSVSPDDARSVRAAFADRDLRCECIGHVDASSRVRLSSGDGEVVLWDLAEQPYTGFRRPAAG